MTVSHYEIREEFGQKTFSAKIVLLDNRRYQLMTPDGSNVIRQGVIDEITFIKADGASGRNGTNGRDGQKGARGSSGRDAYLNYNREVVGTNGGPGGPGGDATAGTNGEDGKNGGDISIYYDESDTDLLDALKVSAKGGEGGRAGRHGIAGEGGDGGAGGRSCEYTVWVESIHYHDHYGLYGCQDDYFFNHHSHFHYSHPIHSHGYPHIDYTPIYRTIPGGHRGANGSRGYQPTHQLVNGRNGQDGRISYHLNNGPIHSQVYQFKFESITVNGVLVKDTPYVPGAFEYGETIEVKATLRNLPRDLSLPHTMSTPDSNEVLVLPNERIKYLQSSHVGTILPNASADADGIRIQILPVFSAYSGNLVLPLTLTFAVHNPRLDRSYQDAEKKYSFDVGYPVYLGKLPLNMSAVNGNNLAFTAKVLHFDHFKRSMNDNRQAKITLFRYGYKAEDVLADQAEWQVAFQSTNTGGVYHETLEVALHWPILPENQWCEIERRKIKVLVTPQYLPDGSGYVLVVNDSTPADQINLLSDCLKALTGSQSIAIYNVSTHSNGLDIGQVIQDYKHGSIFMFNNGFSFENQPVKLGQQIGSFTEDLAADNDASIILTEGVFNAQKDRPIQTCNQTLSSIHGLLTQLFQDDLENRAVYKLLAQRPVDQAKLKQRLKRHFPTRSYYVTRDANNDILIQQVPQSTVQAKTWPIEASAIVKAAPFRQKLRDALHHPCLTDQYHQTYLQAIIDDLQTERASLVESHSYMTLQKTYRHDFTKELTKLNQLLAHVKTMEESQLDLFMPMLIQILAEIQYQAEKQTSFWTWLASFFIIQNEEELAKSTTALATKILSHIPDKIDSKAAAKVTLHKNLKHYVGKRNNHFFFRPGEDTDFNAAENLLKACETSTQPTKNESKRLKAFQDEYEQCYSPLRT